jgi:dipeptidyl aminopeptidase/acylaminoacyl peptidase
VWIQNDGSHTNIYANRYTPGDNWGTATLIETGTGNAYTPQVAFDSDGNAMAVWKQNDGSADSIYANRYTPGGNWGTATLIETGTGNAYKPQIAIDPDGNAIAVWIQNDGSHNSIYANRYIPGGNWGTETQIETGTGTAHDPQIAIDTDGNAMVVWYQYDGSYQSIYANRYTPAANWGTATLIETGTRDAYVPQIAIDPNGNAMAVWVQNDGSFYSIYANRYAPSGNWGTATLIETGTENVGSPQIAIDPNGNAMAVWEQDDGSAYSIYANRFY